MGSECIPAKAASRAGEIEARSLTRIGVALRAEGSEGWCGRTDIGGKRSRICLAAGGCLAPVWGWGRSTTEESGKCRFF